jgi:hypothetical protein
MSSWSFLNLAVLATVGCRVILCNAGKNGNVVPNQIFREVQGGFLGIAMSLSINFVAMRDISIGAVTLCGIRSVPTDRCFWFPSQTFNKF